MAVFQPDVQMKRTSVAVAALLVLASLAPMAATATTSTQSEAYSQTHVTFDTTSSAVVDYQVDGATVLESVRVESAGGGGLGGGLEGAVGLDGSGISLSATAATTATIESESGATLTAHDNGNGVLVVTSGSGEQVVEVGVAGSASAEGDSRVVVDDGDGTHGTFIVVGDGSVAVNEQGNVSATVSGESKLVYRQYEGDRDASDRTQERFIANGTATAEVYYQQTGEGGDRAADVVEYGSDTTVEVTSQTESELNMTVTRTESQGKVVVTHVSDAAMSGASDAQVFVGGEAAAEADAYSEVVAATEGGSESAYLVRSSGSAEATSEVVVGVNHFSSRSMSVQGGEDDGSTGMFGPGFGVVAAVVAVGVALLVGRRL